VRRRALLLIAVSLLLTQEGVLNAKPASHPPVSSGPGHITNDVHPGDPVQVVSVAGFDKMGEALRFVQGGFAARGAKPLFKSKLPRGESLRFAPASFLVFYYHDDKQQPVLLSVSRCHADLHLTIGSCGFQFLLGVDTSPPAPDTLPVRKFLER